MTAPTDTTDTTMPPIDGPAYTDLGNGLPDRDSCIVDGERYFEFQFTTDGDPVDFTDYGVMPCTPISMVTEPAVTVPVVVERAPEQTQVELPSTGGVELALAASAATAICTGLVARRIARG